jgi:hypothetical protein
VGGVSRTEWGYPDRPKQAIYTSSTKPGINPPACGKYIIFSQH